jgi:hypothetical protein
MFANEFWKLAGRERAYRMIMAAFEASLIDSWTMHAMLGALEKPGSQAEFYRFFQNAKATRAKHRSS